MATAQTNSNIKTAVNDIIENFDTSKLYNGREVKTTQKVVRQLKELGLVEYIPAELLDTKFSHYYLLNAIVDAANENGGHEGGYEGFDGDYSVNPVSASKLYQAMDMSDIIAIEESDDGNRSIFVPSEIIIDEREIEYCNLSKPQDMEHFLYWHHNEGVCVITDDAQAIIDNHLTK